MEESKNGGSEKGESELPAIINWRTLFDMQVLVSVLVESLVVETVHLMGSQGRHPLAHG